jgi:glucan endo-1,3-beta-D-glucosidase
MLRLLRRLLSTPLLDLYSSSDYQLSKQPTYNMKRLLVHFLFSTCLAQAASTIYTGFNYGAFWAVEANVKKKADFLDGFGLAKNLTTDTPFDSARLFTCKQAGTLNDPIEAFDAAVESRTNLLLGFWISPAQRGGSPDENVKKEMAALEKGFQKHGQALADLVIGLSVGNEDIYRNEATPGEVGVPANVVAQTIDQVKKGIAASSFAKYMQGKPIGHVDTAKYAVVDNADFIGMTVYPYWNKESVEDAAASFHGSLDDVKKRAGDRPVWIAEMGWPVADKTPEAKDRGAAVPGADQLQKFWTEVGCSVIGKYNTFWFELLNDSDENKQPYWGFIDIPTRQPHVKNLSCGKPNQSPPAAPPPSSQVPPPEASPAPPIVTPSAIVYSQVAAPVLSSAPPPPAGGSPMPALPPNVVAITITVTSVTVVTADLASLGKASSPTGAVVQALSPALGNAKSTVHTTITSYTTIIPTIGVPAPATSDGAQGLDVTIFSTTTVHAKPAPSPSGKPMCAVYADKNGDGKLEVVAVEPADANGKCPEPPPYSSGYPETLIISTAISQTSSTAAGVSSVFTWSYPIPATYTPASSVTFVLASSSAVVPPPASPVVPPPVSSSAAAVPVPPPAAPSPSTLPASCKTKSSPPPPFFR